MTAELLALLIEVTSVGASGRQLREPIDVPRPEAPKTSGRSRSADETDRAFKQGIAVLSRTSRSVQS